MIPTNPNYASMTSSSCVSASVITQITAPSVPSVTDSGKSAAETARNFSGGRVEENLTFLGVNDGGQAPREVKDNQMGRKRRIRP